MTTLVTLRLFFYGLVAFTPDEFECNGNMRALLIDARRPPVASDGCPIHSHHPALFFLAKPGACTSPCEEEKSVNGLCRCDLDKGYLLDIGRNEKDLCFEKDNRCEPDAVDSGSCDAVGFDFIPKLQPMRSIGSRMELHEECDNPCPVRSAYCPGGMCKLLAAQINFNPLHFSVCRMAGQPDDGTPECPKFEFKPLASDNPWNLFWPRDRQVAEIVSFEVQIEVEDPKEVNLTLAAFEDGGVDKIVIPVTKYGNRHYADLVIANFMRDDHHGGDDAYARCAQNYIARDFELYHDLVKQPMYPTDRTIPRAEEDALRVPWKEGKNKNDDYCGSYALKLFRSSFLRAGDSRPICPQALIDK